MAQQQPQSIEAEQALLGSMLIYRESVSLAFEEDLKGSDFFLDANQKIYETIMELDDAKKPIDITSVVSLLSDKNELNSVGGSNYLAQLLDVAASSYNAGYFISLIKDKAVLRNLIDAANRIIDECYDNASDAQEVLSVSEKTIMDLTRNRRVTNFKTSKEAVEDVIANIHYLQQHRGEMTGVPTDYIKLDRITNGFQKSDLIILAARPSVGKTALALNFALNAAVGHKKSVAMFSLEMPAIQLATRLLAAKSNVASFKIKNGVNITNDDWALLADAQKKLSDAKIYIDESSTIKMSEIFSKCRKLYSEEGLDMIIIDYLQLISSPSSKGSDNRQLEVSEISRQLKALARELNVPVIALSQLSRNSEKENRKPNLSDLRESGAIEQDADMVLMLSRPIKKKLEETEGAPEEKPANDFDRIEDRILEILKHRNGAIGEVPLSFQGSINAFYNKEEDDEKNY